MFILHCKDKPGALELRMANRAAHLAYLDTHKDKVVLCGPLQTDDRTAMIGSLLVLNMATRAEVEDFATNDPYAKAGLFDSVTITAFKKVLP